MTLEDLARRAKAILSSSAPLPLVIQWAQERYIELVGVQRLPHMRKRFEIYLPPSITTGTVAFTRSVTTAVGDATAAAAWPADLNEQWVIRAEATNQWYRVLHRAGTTLRLSVGFAGSSASSSGYTLAKRFHAIPADARWLDPLIAAETGSIVERWTGASLDFEEPERGLVGSLPFRYRDGGTNAEGARLLEIYPPAGDSPIIIAADYWPDPKAPGPQVPLSPRMDPQVLAYGIKASIAEWESARAKAAGAGEVAQGWLATLGANFRLWRQAQAGLLEADAGDEESSVVLEGYGADYSPSSRARRITTAEDEYWAIR